MFGFRGIAPGGENEKENDYENEEEAVDEGLRGHLGAARLSHSHRMKSFLACIALVFALTLTVRAQEGESLPERTLRQLVQQQKDLLAEAAKGPERIDQDSLRTQFEQVCRRYETLLRDNPEFAPGFAAYGYLLSKLEQDKESIAMLLKANQLDPNLPLVKNQIGNYLAEHGKPLEALEYFLSAIKLAPKEALYHYQLGTLLHEARDDFITSGEWKRDALDRAMHKAFQQAAELAPDNIVYTYRYATSFYDLETPDWDEALAVWRELEAHAQSPIERQTMRLHEANILLKQDEPDEARDVLATVTEPTLDQQKQKLIAQLPAKPDK
jgi:tetratricopeptide (TPR) repeat protein